MSDQPRVSHPIYHLLPTEIEGFDSLAELALDMRWSWNHATDRVWRTLDPILWELTQNPWVAEDFISLTGTIARQEMPASARYPRLALNSQLRPWAERSELLFPRKGPSQPATTPN